MSPVLSLCPIPNTPAMHRALVGLCCTISVGSKKRECYEAPRRRQEAGEYNSGGRTSPAEAPEKQRTNLPSSSPRDNIQLGKQMRVHNRQDDIKGRPSPIHQSPSEINFVSQSAGKDFLREAEHPFTSSHPVRCPGRAAVCLPSPPLHWHVQEHRESWS